MIGYRHPRGLGFLRAHLAPFIGLAFLTASLPLAAQQTAPARKPAAPPAKQTTAQRPAPPTANSEIIKLATAGMSEDILLAEVNALLNKDATFDTSANALIKLKEAGVSQRVIAAILGIAMPETSPPVAPPSAPAAAVAPPATAEAPPLVEEIGVYYKHDGGWVTLPPEVVNWKTGGILKHIATAGIIKGDVNGMINAPTSKTFVAAPIDILVYTAEGVAVEEYQLLRLRPNKDSREFRTVTGGVLHVSGGATRDLVPFESKKIATRTYQLVLPNLSVGEYGLLAPGAALSSSASAQLGKIYTFRIQ